MLERKQKTHYIFSRFMRLMVPYFVVGLMYVPLKIVLSNEVNGKVNIKTLPLDFVSGNNPNYQLWTLYALFVSATVICLLSNIGYKKLFVITLGLCILSTVIPCPIIIVQQVIYYLFFYLCGIAYRKKYAEKQIKKSLLIGNLLIFIITNVIKGITEFEQLKIVTGIVGIILTCEVCKFMQTKKNNVLDVIGKYSMDIYIMANLVQVFVRSVCLYKVQMPEIICCCISTLLGIILPIIASKYVVRRVKILKRFVLGENDR